MEFNELKKYFQMIADSHDLLCLDGGDKEKDCYVGICYIHNTDICIFTNVADLEIIWEYRTYRLPAGFSGREYPHHMIKLDGL